MEAGLDDGLMFLVEDDDADGPSSGFSPTTAQTQQQHHMQYASADSLQQFQVRTPAETPEYPLFSPLAFSDSYPSASYHSSGPFLHQSSASVPSDIGGSGLSSDPTGLDGRSRPSDPFDTCNFGPAPFAAATAFGTVTRHAWEPQQQQFQSPELQWNPTSIEEFFIKNGAYRPPVPCSYCRRLRLQCLILQTTEANPNPITSCSSCVALFRDCSLAERGKRNASAFETPLPVIGHLHGVNEEDEYTNASLGKEKQPLDPKPISGNDVSGVPDAASAGHSHKKTSTRSVKRTRILRNWFAMHLDHPYPSEDEKSSLAEQSNLSKTQVINWFANARRRHRLAANSYLNQTSKVFLQGSPMPQRLLGGLSPLERWKHSPPEEEPVPASAIENALSTQIENSSNIQQLDHNYNTDGGLSSTSDEPGLYRQSTFQDTSSNSASSGFSFYHSDEAGAFSQSAHSSTHGDQDSIPGPSNKRSVAPASRNKTHLFQCTFCLQSFKKKYDWVRHERSIHLPGLDSWICRVPLPDDQSNVVWRMNHSEAECIFCGQDSPTEEHIQSHEFQACAERPVSERTFTRKDHLWQHLHKFHRCRKWEGWKPNLHLLQHRQDRFESRCGFCQVTTNSWDERVQHLASHFRRGATMAEWTGNSGAGNPEKRVSTSRRPRGGSQSSDDLGSSMQGVIE